MSRLALLSISALVLLSACVPDRGPSYYRDGYYGDGYYRDRNYNGGYYGYKDGYYGGSRYGYRDGYRYRDRSYRPYRGYTDYPGPRPAEGP